MNQLKRSNGRIKREFRPEFMNRIDEIIIVFHKLDNKEIESIIDIMLNHVERLKVQKYYVEFDNSIKDF